MTALFEISTGPATSTSADDSGAMTWTEIQDACPAVALLWANLLAVGPKHPRERLPEILRQAEAFVGPGRPAGRGPRYLWSAAALQLVQNRLRWLAGGEIELADEGEANAH
jgi:hypothetical protein